MVVMAVVTTGNVGVLAVVMVVMAVVTAGNVGVLAVLKRLFKSQCSICCEVFDSCSDAARACGKMSIKSNCGKWKKENTE
jgi:hypothetical protein